MLLNNATRTKILLGLLVSVGIFEFLDAITSSITLFYKQVLFAKVEMTLSDYQFLYLNKAITSVFALILTFCLFYYIYHINRWQQNSKFGVSLQKKTI